ncbi:hypothetical protein GLOIN_2v1770668 [Rhizophagus irregularis DAOM 181602=DAOM 197198]|nr:hypothetical protein GLOIN_2v1770668 [Rhizophagus irregularis DAOM 181602=DAOM 197198]
MTVAFRGKGLTWHPPNEAQTLCHVCGRPGCSPSDNDNSSGSAQPPHRPHPISSIHPTSSSDNPAPTLPQHVVDELKAQIKEIATTLHTLEETVSWMNDTITAHEYRLSELESMMNYDAPGDSELHSPQDDHENYTHSYNNGWDDAPTQDMNSGFNLPPNTSSSLMDVSPDASFSALDPNSVLSRRHVPLPISRPTNVAPADTSRLQSEIFNVTNTQKNLSAQLGISPPYSAILNIIVLIKFLLLPFLLLLLTLDKSMLMSYWAPSPSNSRPHDGVGLLLRHPLHKHVQKIDPWKGQRDAIFAQLNLWLDKARSNNYHVVILGPSPTFYHQNGSSRLDYIWSSPGFPAPGLFSQVETCPKLNDNQFTDHRQKSEQRTIFLYKNLKDDTWDKFSNEVNSRLELYLTTHHPSVSSLSALSLDKLWHALKRSILGGAIDSLPFQHVSNTHHHKYPPELTMLIAVNKFLDRLLFKLTTSRPGRPAQILQMINSLPTQLILLKSLLTDYTIPSYTYLSTQFHQHRVDSIEYYTALRDEHFSTSPGSFISSALSVEHRSIVLDRVLVVIDSKPTLLTDPSDIKQAAIKHFQSVVTPPLVQYSSTDSFPPRWQRAYTPLPD